MPLQQPLQQEASLLQLGLGRPAAEGVWFKLAAAPIWPQQQEQEQAPEQQLLVLGVAAQQVTCSKWPALTCH